MRFWLVVLLMVGMGAGSGVAQKQRYSGSRAPDPLEYPLTVRVSHARLMRPFPAAGGDQTLSSYLHLDTVIDGKHVELETNAGALLEVGDYRARIVANDEKKSGWFSRSYELLFSDGTHVVFTEVAESD